MPRICRSEFIAAISSQNLFIYTTRVAHVVLHIAHIYVIVNVVIVARPCNDYTATQ